MEEQTVRVVLHLSAKGLGKYYGVESYDLVVNWSVLGVSDNVETAMFMVTVSTDPLTAMRLKLMYDYT